MHGNRITALRWQGFLDKLGFTADITEFWSGRNIDLLVALHAYRSHASLMQFKSQYPDKPVALILTGTDLYRDMEKHSEVLHSMEVADQLVVLQPSALKSIPLSLQHKAQVIYQSVEIDFPQVIPEPNLVTVIGHLREEKDPFCIARSLPLLPTDSKMDIRHLGMAMDEEMERTARAYSKQLEHYHWLGEMSHLDTLKLLSQSRLMVISSRMEGGAHVVSEAIALGIPVIASDIPGNRGLLGEDYLGYYPVGNESALATLLSYCETSSDFYSSLKKQIHLRKNLINPEREMQSIQELLAQLTKN